MTPSDPTPNEQDLSWLDELNPQQRKAVMHLNGPLLVVAGAGSGKTKTLAYRVAYLIAQGVDPDRILLLTFTRRASDEMIRRASNVMYRDAHANLRVWGGTFHAIANRLLRIYADAAGLSNNFTVMDQGDAEDMLSVIRHDLNMHLKEKRFPKKGTCLSIYSRCVNGTDKIEDVLHRFFPWCEEWVADLRHLFQQYVIRKQQKQVLDYDDLLLYWTHLVSDPEMSARLTARFDHVLVDEYQDTNKLQAQILRGMRTGNHNIMVVGDDAQSIYSFRAATVRNMLEFPEQFPNTHVVTLDQNYRSVMPILTTTNKVISQSRERFAKDLWSSRTEGQRPKLVTCWTERQQDDFLVQRILEHYEQGIPLHKQAVLFRAGNLADSLEVELTRRGIPYHKYGGLRFLEAAHVKDLLSFLRIAENPLDEMAWFRAMQLIDGVGPSTAGKIIRHVADHQNRVGSIREYNAPAAARGPLEGFVKLMESLADGDTMPPASQVERVRKFYDPILRKNYDNAKVRADDLENIERIASGYSSRSKFLVDLQLDPPNSTSDLAGKPMQDEDWLVLSTIHSAKGCEWDVVYVMHASDGCLPSDMAAGSANELEEELRLLYVAMTRAKDFLYVTWPMRYYHRRYKTGDRHSYAQVSRFLTQDVTQTMDTLVLDQPDEPVYYGWNQNQGGGRNIGSTIRAMWD
jgi:DNA helicase-2/ATP-dependent DNA helicase PcrA